MLKNFLNVNNSMEQLEVKEWMPLLVGVVTAASTLIGVSITSYFSHRSARETLREQRQSKADERRLEKMEELFLLFDKWHLALIQVYLIHTQRHLGKLSMEECEEMAKDTVITIGPGEFQRIGMLIAVHFPELKKHWEKVEEARSLNSPFLFKSSKGKAEEFMKVQRQFSSACKTFKQEIAALSKLSFA